MTVSLSGNWRYCAEDSPEFSQAEWDNSDWERMHLPQNWFLGGLDHHGVVWFRHAFRHRRQKKFATLRFDGVDYFADVYLNGTFLGHHGGYFEPFSFEVSEALRSGKNLLAVRVDSPYETPGPDGWHLRKQLIKGVFNHHDCRPGGGWEPTGQSYNTGGIWNRVCLEEHGPLTIEGVRLRADLETKQPVLHVDVTLRNRTRSRRGTLAVRCTPENFKGKAFTTDTTLKLPEGDSRHQVELRVPEAVRWNPWDRGEPNLYQVSLEIEDAAYVTSFGFRTVRVEEGYHWFVNGERYFPRGSNYMATQWLAEALFPEANLDKKHPFGAQAELHSAGDKPPPGRKTVPPSPGDNSWFQRDVALARQANLNLLRVHAHVLPPEFHTACDRAGMLVWQDFPLQWGYSDKADFQAEAERQMRAMVDLLYNHPSIVAWCCHNESPTDSPWMTGQAGGLYDPNHNRELDARLEAAARELDPGRYVHRNSGTGDGHVYPGWYFSHWRDYRNLPGAPFVTEYGAQGLPVRESLQRTFASLGPNAGHGELVRFKAWIDSQRKISPSVQRMIQVGTALYHLTERRRALKPLQDWLKGWGIKLDRSPYRNLPPMEEIPEELRTASQAWETWRFHDFQPPETFDNGIALGSSLDEFIANSQSYQSNLLQFATEYYRRNKFDKVTGLFQFDFTDPWPSVSWSVLDYWRLPKSAFNVLGRSMQPVLPSIQMPEKIEAGKAAPVSFQAVNDLLEAFPETIGEWRLIGENGDIASATFPISIPANGVSAAVHITLPSLVPGKFQLIATLITRSGRSLGENVYAIKVDAPPQEITSGELPVRRK